MGDFYVEISVIYSSIQSSSLGDRGINGFSGYVQMRACVIAKQRDSENVESFRLFNRRA